MLVWIAFIIVIFALLALDLGVFNKEPHRISTSEAFKWTSLWVSVALLFSVFIYFGYENEWYFIPNPDGLSGKHALLLYLTGYLVEQSLSMDNIFVIAMIFTYFKIPKKYQHRVLFWGILGALFFRGIMIGAGILLIHKFSWMMYVFGLLLLYSAYKMYVTSGEETLALEKNRTVIFLKRFFPITRSLHEDKFFVRRKGILAATPLFLAVMVVETTDILFAFDSIPAIFAITTDPFIVFTSNIFAIMGLRSLYFVLAAMLDKFHYLKYSLILILVFISLKMLLVEFVHLPPWTSLAFIAICMGVGIGYSLSKSGSKPILEKEIEQ